MEDRRGGGRGHFGEGVGMKRAESKVEEVEKI
jgi:hypothetical protein